MINPRPRPTTSSPPPRRLLPEPAPRPIYTACGTQPEFRYWGHYADREVDPVTLDADMHAHAHTEEHIGRLKDSGLLRFPFAGLGANRNWLLFVTAAVDVARWFPLLCLDAALAGDLPKTLRWSLFHAPGRLVRSARREIARVLDAWPAASDLLDGYRRTALLA